jgi:uncharacterized lipoprotein YajG
MRSSCLLDKIRFILVLAGLAGVFLLASCGTSPQPEENAQQTVACELPADVNTSDEVDNFMITRAARPLIDTFVPEKVETATFALG